MQDWCFLHPVFPDSTQRCPHNPKLLKFICPLSNKGYLAIIRSYNESFGMHLLLGMGTLILSRFLFFLLASVVLILTRQLGKKQNWKDKYAIWLLLFLFWPKRPWIARFNNEDFKDFFICWQICKSSISEWRGYHSVMELLNINEDWNSHITFTFIIKTEHNVTLDTIK